MERKLDKYGFPIPATFDDLPDTLQRDKSASKQKRKLSDKGLVWKRRIIVATMFLVVCIVIGVQYRKSIMRWVAESQAKTAHEAFIRQDFKAAKRYFALAMWFDEENLAYRLRHASVAKKLRQFDQAYNDLTHIIEFKVKKQNSNDDQKQILASYQIEALVDRAYVQYEMEKPGPAIADMNRAIDLSQGQDRTNLYSRNFLRETHELLNSRAYLRALTKTDLKEALSDVNRALDLANNVPEYLDTRGYLYCLTNEFEKAVTDLDSAIEQTEALYSQRRHSRFALHRFQANQLRESLAVMYYHRSLTHQGLNNEQKANDDTLRAAEFGYDPKNGVF